MPRFIVHAEGERREVALERPSVLIGRGTGSDLRINDRLASRAHCRIDLENEVKKKEGEISDIEASTARWQTKKQCDAAKIDSDAKTKSLLLEIKKLHLEMLKTQRKIASTLSDIQVNFRDGGSGETSATISCQPQGGSDLTPTSTNPPTGWDSSATHEGLTPGTYICTVVIDP